MKSTEIQKRPENFINKIFFSKLAKMEKSVKMKKLWKKFRNFLPTSKQLRLEIYFINEIFLSDSSFTEPNWGLPLAIAANLHTPYRIEIGVEEILKVNFKDKIGKGEFFFRIFCS